MKPVLRVLLFYGLRHTVVAHELLTEDQWTELLQRQHDTRRRMKWADHSSWSNQVQSRWPKGTAALN
jgi:hypothetical protein